MSFVLSNAEDQTLLFDDGEFSFRLSSIDEIAAQEPGRDDISELTPVDRLRQALPPSPRSRFGTIGVRANVPTETAQKRGWFITVSRIEGRPPKLDPSIFAGDRPRVTSMAAQYEHFQHGGLHCHIFVMFDFSVRFGWVKRKLHSAFGHEFFQIKFIQPEDYAATFDYCSKMRTRANELTHLATFYNRPEFRAGRRTGTVTSRSTSRSTSTGTTSRSKANNNKARILAFLMEDVHKTYWEHYERADEDLKLLMSTHVLRTTWNQIRATQIVIPDRKIEEVIILYGAAGAGKTHYAKTFPNAYVKNRSSGKWFPGIKREHETLVIEEMDGRDINLNMLLELCNLGYDGPIVEKKCDCLETNYKRVVITSNRHPLTWYKEGYLRAPEMWVAFARRVTKCIYYPLRKQDGSHNRYNGVDEVEFEEENLLNITATQAWMGWAHERMGQEITTVPEFQAYVNRMM